MRVRSYEYYGDHFGGYLIALACGRFELRVVYDGKEGGISVQISKKKHNLRDEHEWHDIGPFLGLPINEQVSQVDMADIAERLNERWDEIRVLE